MTAVKLQTSTSVSLQGSDASGKAKVVSSLDAKKEIEAQIKTLNDNLAAWNKSLAGLIKEKVYTLIPNTNSLNTAIKNDANAQLLRNAGQVSDIQKKITGVTSEIANLKQILSGNIAAPKPEKKEVKSVDLKTDEKKEVKSKSGIPGKSQKPEEKLNERQIQTQIDILQIVLNKAQKKHKKYTSENNSEKIKKYDKRIQRLQKQLTTLTDQLNKM